MFKYFIEFIIKIKQIKLCLSLYKILYLIIKHLFQKFLQFANINPPNLFNIVLLNSTY
jgi:hypothetical protein